MRPAVADLISRCMVAEISTKSRSGASPIGVFDSGVGGLSVLQELRRLLPREKFVFLADQANVPYGGKTGPQLVRLTSRITRFLLRKNCKAVVVACNTATCYAIEALRGSFSVPFVGTVPAVKPACRITRTGVVGVISTPATARSAALRHLVREFSGATRVLRVGCPGLEELVERGGINHPDTRLLLTKYLRPLRAAGADVVVLGCTHYPFLKSSVRRIGNMRTVDSGRAIARQTRRLLREYGLLAAAGRGSVAYFTTGDATAFSRVASQLLDVRIRASRARI